MDVVFDSDVLPAAARASGWQELADNALCVTQVRYPDEGSLKVRLKAVALRDGVQLAALTYGSLACRRTPALHFPISRPSTRNSRPHAPACVR